MKNALERFYARSGQPSGTKSNNVEKQPSVGREELEKKTECEVRNESITESKTVMVVPPSPPYEHIFQVGKHSLPTDSFVSVSEPMSFLHVASIKTWTVPNRIALPNELEYISSSNTIRANSNAVYEISASVGFQYESTCTDEVPNTLALMIMRNSSEIVASYVIPVTRSQQSIIHVSMCIASHVVQLTAGDHLVPRVSASYPISHVQFKDTECWIRFGKKK